MASCYDFTKHLSDNWQKVVYTFSSEGKNGCIIKVVEFELIKDSEKKLYNCAFGDFDEDTLSIKDTAITNNGDFFKVINTVIQIVFDFLNQNRNFIVYIFGTDQRRLIVYQRLIKLYFDDISRMYVIYGGFYHLDDKLFKLTAHSSKEYDYYLVGNNPDY